MSFKIVPQIKENELHLGCLNCSTAASKAPMDMVISVGFGSAFATKDGEIIYDERDIKEGQEYLTVAELEKIAKEDPDHDWRIHKHGPMHGEVFQRHGENNWVCIESDQGFA